MTRIRALFARHREKPMPFLGTVIEIGMAVNFEEMQIEVFSMDSLPGLTGM
jgi:hypothetical protein